jgi:Flp pilus assembly protein TadB
MMERGRIGVDGGVATSSVGGLVRGVAAALVAVVLAVTAVVFSVVVLAVVATLGLCIGGWLWWKTRALRRQLREQQAAMEAQLRSAAAGAGGSRTAGGDDGIVIEGEYSRQKDEG